MLTVLIVLLLLSLWQAVGFARYSKMAQAIHGTEQELRVDDQVLGKHVAELESRLDRPESSAKLSEIGFLNHLILRRNFSWTRLFVDLENLVPDNVHLTNLTPDVGVNGAVTLHLGVQAHSIADVTVFVNRLEKSPVFSNVTISSEEKREPNLSNDVDLVLSTTYYPQRENQ
jgi:Tfp pilus assembly protein PilN